MAVSLFYLFVKVSAPRMLTKPLEILIALLRKLMVRSIILLDDILIMATSIEELKVARIL